MQPTNYIVKSTNYKQQGIPVLTAGQTFILGYTDETDGIFQASKDNPVIIFDDFTTSMHWVEFPFKVKSSAMKMLRPKNNIALFKYLFYLMKTIKVDTTEHARQWIATFSQLTIPIPTLSRQKEIVEILDKFDTLVNDISKGIPLEIELRKKQYEYYRGRLLKMNG